ncbi:24708_t:CDS:2, partial [Gigaspora margarita]
SLLKEVERLDEEVTQTVYEKHEWKAKDIKYVIENYSRKTRKIKDKDNDASILPTRRISCHCFASILSMRRDQLSSFSSLSQSTATDNQIVTAYNGVCDSSNKKD